MMFYIKKPCLTSVASYEKYISAIPAQAGMKIQPIFNQGAIMVARLLVSLLLLTPFAVLAQAVPAPLQGVWSGTIGTKDIVACFNKFYTQGWPFVSYGSYYYLAYLKPIALSTEKTPYWYYEGHENDTGRWELSVPVNGVMEGTWRNPKTEKTFPIHLTLVDGNDDEEACARDSYNLNLEKNLPKVEKGKIIQFSPERSYRKLRFAGQETIELYGPDSGLKRINAQIKLEQSKEAVDSYFQQRRLFLGRVGYPAVDQHTTEPKYWDSNLIMIEFYTWVAGEGRSGITNDYPIWNTKTGEKVDLWRWIGSNSNDRVLPKKLMKFLYKNLKEDPECENKDYRSKGDYTITLNKTGLDIYEEAWGDGCEKSFSVPYEKLYPFLTPAGKKAVDSILGRK